MTRTEARLATWLAAVSAILLALRIIPTRRVGFGDSEALYACYALHPQPSYLDHPGFIGVVARALGDGGPPTPYAAHVFTSIAATCFPLVVGVTARALGAALGPSLAAALAVAVAPEIAVGLFALTPDLPLAFAWVAALGFAGSAIAAEPRSARAATGFLGAGLAVGVAAASKVSGVALLVAIAATLAAPPARRHARTSWPYLGLAVAAVVVIPILVFEERTGFPMLRHRLLDTQASAGVSLRNAAGIVFGQLAYLSPLLAVAALYVGVDVVRRRERDAIDVLLLAALLFPLAILVPLCLWSRVAEPHWLAPAFLALPLHFARRAPLLSPRITPGFARAAIATSLLLVLGVHAWVLVPNLVRVLPADADPRFDLANELYGWPAVTHAVAETVSDARVPDAEPGDIVVVGPHWVVCAQLHATLPREIAVGCATPIPDDFDRWRARADWRKAEALVLVMDNRFEVDVDKLAPEHTPVRAQSVTITRGGRVARVFKIVTLVRRAAG